MDIQNTLQEQKMEIDLLKERASRGHGNRDLESRISEIEKTQSKISADMRNLHQSLGRTCNALATLEKQVEVTTEKINEVTKLKTTLNSISKAIGTNQKTHRVASGDTLEKIARKNNTTIEALKQTNGLHSNTIIVGQELRIP